MSISLVEVAGANFRTGYDSDQLNTDFMGRLGMRKRYLPARLAIALSLARPSQPPPLPKGADWGKVIKGDTLFGTGTELSVWLALIVERSGGSALDTEQLIALVAAHWQRGLDLLDDEWSRADADLAQFVRRLVGEAGLPITGVEAGGQYDVRADVQGGEIVSSGRIEAPIGEVAKDAATDEPVFWQLNGAGGSPHSAIMGGVGSGKTRTAVAMLRAIREQAEVPLLAFDFKGDLGTDEAGGGYRLDELFAAKTPAPPREPIPLDVLALGAGRDQIAIDGAAMRFRECFAHLKGSRLGEKQRTALYDAATQALGNKTPCDLGHILAALTNVYEEREMKEDGALATMRELCRFPLFKPALPPAEFFRHSWLIKLPPSVPADHRSIVVNLTLNALDQYLNSLADAPTDADADGDGARSLRIICLVDEAHHVLRTKLPSLSNLIRMSRSKGGAIMLISQSPDDFSAADDDFLAEMGLVAAFATNAAPRHVKRILSKGANLSRLQTGQCFIKRRGEPTVRKIKAW